MILFSTPNEPDLDPVLADAVRVVADLIRERHPDDGVQATLAVAALADLLGVGGVAVEPGASVEVAVEGLEREIGRLTDR